MRKAHELSDEYEDVATMSLLDNFINETERRIWLVFEASRQVGDNTERTRHHGQLSTMPKYFSI